MWSVSEEGSYLKSALNVPGLHPVSKPAYEHSLRKTDLDLIQYCQDKYIQGRVSPPYDHTPKIGSWEVRRPEHAHQGIIFWHDNSPRQRSCAFKMTRVASVALWRIYLILATADAGQMVSARSCLPWVVCCWHTRFASRVATRSIGIKTRRKTRLRATHAFAPRDCA